MLFWTTFSRYFVPQIYWFLMTVNSPNYFAKLAPEIFSTMPLRVESLKKPTAEHVCGTQVQACEGNASWRQLQRRLAGQHFLCVRQAFRDCRKSSGARVQEMSRRARSRLNGVRELKKKVCDGIYVCDVEAIFFCFFPLTDACHFLLLVKRRRRNINKVPGVAVFEGIRA